MGRAAENTRCQSLNFEGPDSHDDLYVCGNPCIFERENIPTEVIRDRAECKPVYQILRKL